MPHLPYLLGPPWNRISSEKQVYEANVQLYYVNILKQVCERLLQKVREYSKGQVFAIQVNDVIVVLYLHVCET